MDSQINKSWQAAIRMLENFKKHSAYHAEILADIERDPVDSFNDLENFCAELLLTESVTEHSEIDYNELLDGNLF